MSDKMPIYYTSKTVYNNDLLEQVYIPEKNMSYYLRWDSQKQEPIIMDCVEDGRIRYQPIQDDLLEKKAVILPTGIQEYESDDDLDMSIETFISSWVDISPPHLRLSTWYTKLTWVIDNLHTIPYLRALGDYGTGKTRYLDVIGGLCYKPMFVGGSVRSAPIYRVIDKWRGTAIFDEFTLKKSDESEDIIQILNNGFQRGKPVLRCADGNYDKVQAFDPFCPKILASRDTFQDRALESRCITEIMQQTDRTDIPTDFTSEFFKMRTELQNKLLLFRFRNWKTVNPDESIHIDFKGILPRIKQTLLPFTVLFQYDQDRLNGFVQYAQDYNSSIIQDNADSFDGQIVNHYLKLVKEHDIAQQTLDDYEPPSITASKIRESMINDGWSEDKLRASTIGRHLKNLGFQSIPKKIRIEDGTSKTMKVIEIDDKKLKRLKMRYVMNIVTGGVSVC